MERIERRLTIQEAVRAELEIEVAQNEQLATNLWEAQKSERAHTMVVEKLQKELSSKASRRGVDFPASYY